MPIRNHNAADPAAARLLVAMLHRLQGWPEPLAQCGGAGLDMHVPDATGAIGLGGNREKQRRAHDVADLDAGMVLAVAEGRQLKDAAIDGRSELVLLREDGMRDVDVLQVVATVRDAEAEIAPGFEKMVEVTV